MCAEDTSLLKSALPCDDRQGLRTVGDKKEVCTREFLSIEVRTSVEPAGEVIWWLKSEQQKLT